MTVATRQIAMVTAAAFLAVATCACEENLAPPHEPVEPFSIYGVVSPQLDTQSVRVYPIEQFLTVHGRDAVEAIQVSSIHIQTGDVRTWTDSVVVGADQEPQFIFKSDFAAEYGAKYRIEVERESDGATSTVDVQIPEAIEIEVVDPRPQTLKLAIRGGEFSMLNPVVGYTVQLPGDGFPALTYEVSYQGEAVRTKEGWHLTVQLAGDRASVQSQYNQDAGTLTGTTCNALWLRRFSLSMIVGDSAWYPPGGTFNSDILSVGGTMSNVENGFGFVGAGYRHSDAIRLDQDLVEGACYVYFPS